MIIDLSKKQAIEDDPKAIQEINSIENLDRAGNTTMLFILEKVKKTIVYFFQNKL